MKKFLILAAIAVLAFGCSKTEENKNSAAVNESTAPDPKAEKTLAPPAKEETFTAGKDPRADLISAAQKRQKLPFWSAKVTVEGMPELGAIMEFSAPGSYRFKLPSNEAIVIGKDTYSNEEGKWIKEDQSQSDNIREQITNGINEGAANLKDVQIVGTETVNGSEATVYTHTADGITTRVWLDAKSGLELKNEIELDSEETGKLKRTTVYDYITPVKIEAPKID